MEIDEIFMTMDFPRLFSCVTPGRTSRFLVQWADDLDDDGNEWMVVAISEQRLESVRTGEISLHDAFKQAEEGVCLWISHELGAETPEESWLPLESIEDDYFHEPDVRLSLTPRVLEIVRDATDASAGRRRVVANLHFGRPDQESIHLLDLARLSANSGGILSGLGANVACSAGFPGGSFVIQVQSEKMDGMFLLDSDTGVAIENLGKLVAANYTAQDPVKVIEELGIRAKKNVKRLLTSFFAALADTGSAFEIEYSGPERSTAKRVSLSVDDIRWTYAAFKRWEEAPPQEDKHGLVHIESGFKVTRPYRRTVDLETPGFKNVDYSCDPEASVKGFLDHGIYAFEISVVEGVRDGVAFTEHSILKSEFLRMKPGGGEGHAEEVPTPGEASAIGDGVTLPAQDLNEEDPAAATEANTAIDHEEQGLPCDKESHDSSQATGADEA